MDQKLGRNVNCTFCNKEHYVKLCMLKKGWGKFCSLRCARNGGKKTGENHHKWKGNDVGIDGIHQWLKKYYGKANRCESINCLKLSKIFQWALLKGKEYERKRENFWQLCIKCHLLYDSLSHTKPYKTRQIK